MTSYYPNQWWLDIRRIYGSPSLNVLNKYLNKANLRDLTAATGLVIVLKLDSNCRFSARVTLKFDGWPWKIIRHVLYTTSSFVYHFRSISEFKLELQSGNALSGSNLMIFFSHVTLQFNVWPWKTTGHLFYATSSCVHHFVAISGFKLELVRKWPIWVKIDDFLAVWPCNLTYDLEKQ